MYPFVRAPEHRAPVVPGSPGIMVISGTRRWFFPGASERTARPLMEAMLAASVRQSPHTRIEFGTAAGAAWFADYVIKAAAESPGVPHAANPQ